MKGSSKLVYLLLVRTLVDISSHGVVGDVEGVVLGRDAGVQPALHHKRVGLAAHHVDLRDEKTIDVVGYAPANVF